MTINLRRLFYFLILTLSLPSYAQYNLLRKSNVLRLQRQYVRKDSVKQQDVASQTKIRLPKKKESQHSKQKNEIHLSYIETPDVYRVSLKHKYQIPSKVFLSSYPFK